MKKLLFLFVCGVVMLSSCSTSQKEQVSQDVTFKEISDNWQFKQSDKDEWMPATVPGCVHTDLLANKKIEDPFYRLNEHNQQWIDKKDWEYKTTFQIEENDFSKTNIELIFKGLDTYSEIYINDSMVLETNNMFREWRVDCKPVVQPGANNLRIVFRSPTRIGEQKYDNNGFLIPVSNNDLSEIGGMGDKRVSVYTRKAGYHYGWDWGPRLVTSGIWRPVILKCWNNATLEDVFIRQKKLSNDKAELTALVEINSVVDENAKITISSNDKTLKNKTIALKSGNNSIEIPFTIENPALWWPNGMGEQKMYDISVELSSASTKDKVNHRIGLRTVELITEPDSIGTSFYFKINGHPVFMKGANYIPQDNFIPRVTEERYKHILQSAVDANMNMLRVWGGGIYENDIFYDLCDEMGLLVWQDFMFACAMFPGDEAFLENVKHEAVDNVKRLRNHPSIALWCGNNECLSAWKGWGWEDKVTEEQGKEVADKIWKAYTDIFHKILPETVNQYDSDRFYWSSSPSCGMGKKSVNHAGDQHYWGVWWGKEPFASYETVMPRFMSEFGFQSFPELASVRKYAVPEDFDIQSEVMRSHQRSTIGNETIEEYLLRDYKAPKDFESFLYVSHILQAEGIRFGMEAHRRNRHRCMGSLYWQINDCWPVASWSGIDYFGRWKALHYFAKKAFEDILVSPELKTDTLSVTIISDRLKPAKATLDLAMINFSGDTVWSEKKPIEIDANKAAVVWKNAVNEIAKANELNKILLIARVTTEENKGYQNIFYLLPPKDLQLSPANITIKAKKADNGYQLVLSSDILAKNVYLTIENEGFFTDNYFDLLPNTEKTIVFETKEEIADIEKKIKMLSLIDTY